MYFNDEAIVTCARDRTLRIYDRRAVCDESVFSGKPVQQFVAGAALAVMQCSRDMVAAGSLNGYVHIYHPSGPSYLDMAEVEAFQAHTAGVFSLQYDDEVLVSGAKDSTGTAAYGTLLCSRHDVQRKSGILSRWRRWARCIIRPRRRSWCAPSRCQRGTVPRQLLLV